MVPRVGSGHHRRPVPLLRSRLLAEAGFLHAFPTRDAPDAALLDALGVPAIGQAKQVHGARAVLLADAPGQERGRRPRRGLGRRGRPRRRLRPGSPARRRRGRRGRRRPRGLARGRGPRARVLGRAPPRDGRREASPPARRRVGPCIGLVLLRGRPRGRRAARATSRARRGIGRSSTSAPPSTRSSRRSASRRSTTCPAAPSTSPSASTRSGATARAADACSPRCARGRERPRAETDGNTPLRCGIEPPCSRPVTSSRS